MLVSKQFFVEAAHDSVAHQTFSFSNSGYLFSVHFAE